MDIFEVSNGKTEKRQFFMKQKVFDVIQIGEWPNIMSRVFDFFIVFQIFLNIAAAFLLTFEEMQPYFPVFYGIEAVTTVVFCLEYLLRIWTADLLYPEQGRWKAVCRFFLSYDGIIDLFTILPVSFLMGFIVFRMLRVIRIFHLFRITKQYDSFNVIATVFREKRNQIFSSIFIILLLMLGSSLCMYGAEHQAQPSVFKNAFSGLWWAVNTVLTVGYGDIYPVTVFGRCMAIVFEFLGVGAVAIPTGIISAGFVEQYTKKAAENEKYQKMDIADVLEILVDEKLEGKTLSEVRENEGLLPYLVIRNRLTVLPSDDLVLQREDILVAQMER